MELNVWTSSTVINTSQDPITKVWSVVVKQQDGKERVFKVKHIVLAIGFKGNQWNIPTFPGQVWTRLFILLRLVDMDGNRTSLKAKYFILRSTARPPIMLGKR